MIPVCHQKILKDQIAESGADEDLFGKWWDGIDTGIGAAELREVSISTAAQIIEKYEYLGTMCNAPIKAYGIFWEGNCGGVVVFGAVSPPNVAASVSKGHPKRVIQLARGASVHWAHKHASSKLIGYALREVAKLGYWFVVAYSDPDAGEIGTVYQATNWLYCGLTKKRPDYITPEGKRLVGNVPKGFVDSCEIVERTRKHRCIFVLGNKRERKARRPHLSWVPDNGYPKRDAQQG